eukprot:gene1457-2803_t
MFSVENAESGLITVIELDNDKLSLRNLKESIFDLTGITTSDQILLIGDGTKYKTIDANFGENMQSDGRRIFLFDRRTMVNGSVSPIFPILQPHSILEPDPDEDLEIPGNDFQKACSMLIRRGEKCLETSELCLESSRSLRAQQQVQSDALLAARSSIEEQFDTDSTAFLLEKSKLESQQRVHENLLSDFESHLQSLREIPLHPALVESWEEGMQSGSASASGSGINQDPTTSQDISSQSQSQSQSDNSRVRMLADLLPLERERAWAKHCAVAYEGMSIYVMLSFHITPTTTTTTTDEIKNNNKNKNQWISYLKYFSHYITIQVEANLKMLGNTFEKLATGMQLLDGVAAQGPSIPSTSTSSASQLRTPPLSSSSTSSTPPVTAAATDRAPPQPQPRTGNGNGSGSSSEENKTEDTSTPTSTSIPLSPTAAGSITSSTTTARSRTNSYREFSDSDNTMTSTLSMSQCMSASSTECLHTMRRLYQDYEIVNSQSRAHARVRSQPVVSESESESTTEVVQTEETHVQPTSATGTESESMSMSTVPITGEECCDTSTSTSTSTSDFSRSTALTTQLDALLSRMQGRAQASIASKDRVAEYRLKADRYLRQQLRLMAAMQGDIQPKLRKGILFLRQLRRGDNQYFKHLELAKRLPETYRGVLKEVVRRKEYDEIFQTRAEGLLRELYSMREEEIRCRESFMSEIGVFMPPAMLQLAPALKLKPQYPQLTLTESQWLPDISRDDLINMGIIINIDTTTPSPTSSPDMDASFDETAAAVATVTVAGESSQSIPSPSPQSPSSSLSPVFNDKGMEEGVEVRVGGGNRRGTETTRCHTPRLTSSASSGDEGEEEGVGSVSMTVTVAGVSGRDQKDEEEEEVDIGHEYRYTKLLEEIERLKGVINQWELDSTLLRSALDEAQTQTQTQTQISSTNTNVDADVNIKTSISAGDRDRDHETASIQDLRRFSEALGSALSGFSLLQNIIRDGLDSSFGISAPVPVPATGSTVDDTGDNVTITSGDNVGDRVFAAIDETITMIERLQYESKRRASNAKLSAGNDPQSQLQQQQRTDQLEGEIEGLKFHNDFLLKEYEGLQVQFADLQRQLFAKTASTTTTTTTSTSSSTVTSASMSMSSLRDEQQQTHPQTQQPSDYRVLLQSYATTSPSLMSNPVMTTTMTTTMPSSDTSCREASSPPPLSTPLSLLPPTSPIPSSLLSLSQLPQQQFHSPSPSPSFESSDVRISFRSFSEGDVALFVPARQAGDVFLAFNNDCPHHYLAQESLLEIQASNGRRKLMWVVGRIIMREEAVEEAETRNSAYGLSAGTNFVKLFVERLYQGPEKE